MRFALVSAAVAAVIASALAQTPGFDSILAPTSNQELPAGSSFDIIWQPGSQTGKITITLLQGATPGSLQLGPTVASGVDNQAGKYTWSVPSSSSYATYGFQITLDGATGADAKLQYSFPFHISGGSASSSSQSSTPSSSAAATSVDGSSSTTGSAAPTNSSQSATVTSSSTKQTVTSTSSGTPTTKTVISIPTTSGGSASTSIQVVKTSSTAMSTATQAPTSGTNTTSTGVPKVSGNSAASNVARGSLVLLGGLMAAFVL